MLILYRRFHSILLSSMDKLDVVVWHFSFSKYMFTYKLVKQIPAKHFSPILILNLKR